MTERYIEGLESIDRRRERNTALLYTSLTSSQLPHLTIVASLHCIVLGPVTELVRREGTARVGLTR